MAESLGLAVIAEGVEEPSVQAAALLYCSGAQGFLFSRPLPAAGIIQCLQDHGNKLRSRIIGA